MVVSAYRIKGTRAHMQWQPGMHHPAVHSKQDDYDSDVGGGQDSRNVIQSVMDVIVLAPRTQHEFPGNCPESQSQCM